MAAGDGAFRSSVTGPTWSTAKSSSSDPSRPQAWARTPAAVFAVRSDMVSSGMKRRALR